ncbi:hypothetical protein A2331_04145 [Candidatus Falkowbacteria bacterium RIFOXYB2_FULL_34_18]|uniref:Lipoprotein n=1 Tax=Candidatus Falkowbacteria bacterium RIFOXYD2_FULL_34_120 TaxID=1798007 RepID=A0A1F5TS16_9BACT|nr:MAG: hypothetical protein A2331_04145 [Candidatus Falkowbacteria bacterium RIFOXYB2_FULL_34_18]OGF29716.1 MAG: hypothetical protein A2500_00380 [Candidatus Falkowbacteria bacterium RIFOXYC12_FULL_34_55]OGF37419.1 MAG: hypothetical protein A2466_00340 [Candidatus Falkowbacteria bacterium RIFOXYC2_FULL_34_220]OGF39144.1 MAG: hypothetical protein A2515_00295 [Candidatus Falkowbacteria bacterium RIFOXYD12_FULL_34_57]OGF41693.1 MAG: hypothetical protein A2531_06015 [Candidatus Falkowbacteria bact
MKKIINIFSVFFLLFIVSCNVDRSWEKFDSVDNIFDLKFKRDNCIIVYSSQTGDLKIVLSEIIAINSSLSIIEEIKIINNELQVKHYITTDVYFKEYKYNGMIFKERYINNLDGLPPNLINIIKFYLK